MLLEKIKDVLTKRNIQFSELSDHLGIPEDSLEYAFKTNTVEIRTLERISKELKIPLYRFFREPVGNLMESMRENQMYAMITNEELMQIRLELEVARKEIEILKNEMASKNEVIRELSEKLKNRS